MLDANDREASLAESADTVAQLIRTAGRRTDPPREARKRTLAAATTAWRAKIRRNNRRRWSVAIAASILIAMTALLVIRNAPQAPALVAATTDRIIGTVEMKMHEGAWTTLRGDASDLHAGTRLRTHSGSLAGIVLAGGASLRVANGTDIILESSARVRVLSGKVYLDNGATHGAQPLEVATAAGTAVDVGTQFEVLYRDDAYRLRVREGRVRLRREAGVIESKAGEQVTIDARGALARAELRADDADWDWVQVLAPPPEIEGQPLSVLLAWVARETGKAIRFEEPELERRAQTTILHGNIRLLSPLDALSVMLATTELEHTLTDDDTILIRLKAQHR